MTLRLGLGVVAVLTMRLLGSPAPPGGWPEQVIRGGEPWSLFLSGWQRWDAIWYQRIAEDGYRAGDGTTHFLPLYPLLTSLIALVLGNHVVLAQLVVSSVAFLVVVWHLEKLARLDVRPEAARLTVLLLLAWPSGFFLFAPYTESLFLASTLAAFWWARTGHPWAAGLAAGAASLTRVFGVFLFLPLAWMLTQPPRRRTDRLGLERFAVILPLLAYGTVLLYFRFVVGERRSPYEVAAPWGERLTFPGEAVAASWMHVVRHGDVIEALNLGSLLMFAGLSVIATKRLPASYALYIWPILLFLLSRQSHVSPFAASSRYVLALFPCFIVLAAWLVDRPRLAAGLLVISGLVETILFVHWVRWGWVA